MCLYIRFFLACNLQYDTRRQILQQPTTENYKLLQIGLTVNPPPPPPPPFFFFKTDSRPTLSAGSRDKPHDGSASIHLPALAGYPCDFSGETAPAL